MKRIIFVISILFFALSAVFVYQKIKFDDGKLHLVFCDVGQGDGIFIRTPGGSDILIDGGPDDSILKCLSNHMPFWDRKIELMLLTHPHSDHMTGLISILRSYQVSSFATEKLGNTTAMYNKLAQVLKNKNLEIRYVYSGDSFEISDGLSFKILGPSKEFLDNTSPTGEINESEGFGNLVTLISYENFKAILTGDSQVEGLKDAISGSFPVEVLQIPHHGSKYGLDKQILENLDPKFAVISVGKNKYGHPTKEILDLLTNQNIKLLRTDQDGEVEIISDGKTFAIR